MYIFDLCTGMRLGELLGLKWSDIDFQENQLHIERTLSKVKDPDKPDESWHLAFGAPKTPASERTIPLHDTAIKLLTDILEQQKQDKAKAVAAYRTMTLYSAPSWAAPKTLSICAALSIESAIRPVSAASTPIVSATHLPPEGPKIKWIYRSCSVSLDTPTFKRQQAPIPMCWATSNGPKCKSWRAW